VTPPLVLIGWTERPISAAFATPPAVEVGDADMHVDLTGQYTRLAYPVTAEGYVSKLLDRAEMRALCNAKQTRRSIVDALGSCPRSMAPIPNHQALRRAMAPSQELSP
jgi:hypothetical protein